MDGETFHPWPSSRDACAPVPSVAMPARPFSPLKFSALMERVFAFDSREILWSPMPRPLNPFIDTQSSCGAFPVWSFITSSHRRTQETQIAPEMPTISLTRRDVSCARVWPHSRQRFSAGERVPAVCTCCAAGIP